MTLQRRELLDAVAARLRAQDPGHPLRIGIDGVCGSGKTTFGDELAALLAEGPRPVIRLDSDGFHNERAVRYRQGRDSARGYYEDAYALDSLRLLTLEPLGPDGTRRYAEHLHDLETDRVAPRFADAADDAILVFDATFIQRDELRDHWDEVIYLDAPREHALERGVQRDVARGADADASRELYDARYLAACDIYLEEQDPRTRASILIDHADPSLPLLLR
ncbi:AAA family ATPase [Microbacterium stercoris]|uniref:AAA family ATPase n=1 Tax=Microbacterium stercoris TaxID=2820289 RepID=A0A939QNK7_9MICO|nr:AAA family ATPase [Microbacterium stercoris]MBO3662018.1 AAA family ATPase [Microbacterium stercoris]